MSARIQVPGKVILAGEYAVLAGAPALVTAVRRYLTCEVTDAPAWSIEGNGARWTQGEASSPELRFACETLRVVSLYLEGIGSGAAPAKLRIEDALRGPDGTKLGLGGSACTCAAVAAAVLSRAGRPLDKPLLFKLAAAAHGKAQGKVGSAIDLAASVFGGLLWTRRFEVGPLLAALAGGARGFAAAVDRTSAPDLERLGACFPMLLAFTGKAASTPVLVEQIERFGAAEPKEWASFVARTSEAGDRLRRAIAAGQSEQACRALRDAGRLLEGLGQAAGVPIVIDTHRRIGAAAEASGAAAKVTGAGGGDCSVLLGTDEALAATREALGREGILAFEPGIDRDGLAVEEQR